MDFSVERAPPSQAVNVTGYAAKVGQLLNKNFPSLAIEPALFPEYL
jgi:hypothetical protein